MADPIVLVALALLAGAPLALAPVATAFAAIAMAAALRAKCRRGAAAIALAALLFSGMRAHVAIDGAEATHRRAVELLRPPARCEGEARVVSSPVVLRRGVRGEPAPDPHGEPAVDEGAGDVRVDLSIDSGACGDKAIVAPLRARVYGAPEGLARGDRVLVLADLAPVHLFRNEGLADPRPGIARSGVAASGGAIEVRVLSRSHGLAAFIDRARGHVRGRIEATFHADAEALARALVLGESDLDPADDEAFRLSGLSHLLAVSGTHLVIAVAGFAAALRALLVRIGPLAGRMDAGRLSAMAAIPASWIYADFAGGSGSAIRAAAMLSAAMLARALGGRGDIARVFAWSLLLLAAFDPLLACDLSFSLSAAATAGLVVVQPSIAEAIVRGPAAVKKLLAAVATTLSAMVGCTPLIALLSPSLPLLSIASNLIAAPLGELAALPVCLLHAVLSWAPPLERGAALLGSGALLGVRAVARWSSATGAVVQIPRPTPAQLAALAAFGTAAWAAQSRTARAAAVLGGATALAVCEWIAIDAGAPRGTLRISVLDVGQGDAVLIDFPDGSAMLVDGGGFVGSPVDTGERVLLPVLRARRRHRVDVVVLSHPHPDHFGGLVSTVPAIDVGELWDTGQGEDQGAGPAYARLLAGVRSRGIPIRRPDSLCGRPRVFGGATVEVLAPCPAVLPDVGANDNSFVLRIAYGERAALLVGDAEHDEEAGLIHRQSSRIRADFLKVGHHGSRTSSTPAFLRVVAPSLAAISSGIRNRFGHPHPTTLATLAAHAIPVARTDQGGEIVWETDGREVHVTRP